jgi:hypothetical protein
MHRRTCRYVRHQTTPLVVRVPTEQAALVLHSPAQHTTNAAAGQIVGASSRAFRLGLLPNKAAQPRPANALVVHSPAQHQQ